MKQALNRISATMTAVFSMIFNLMQKQADHQKLTRHILELNKKQSSKEIINEVALCLKDIINYRLFAFVIKKETTVDVWLDPRMYKDSLENIILKDFIIENKDHLTYLNHSFHCDEPREHFNMNDLIFYDITQDNIIFRIYMLPNKKPYAYQDEVVTLILQGCSFALSQQLKIESLKDAAIIDPLTGCYNRREFENQLKRNMAGAVRHKADMSVFMFDLDHFKKINDTYGHIAGDKILKETTRLVKESMRSGDILARYGGEEFIAILPKTNKIKAMELADRLREKISKLSVEHNGAAIQVTASFGVAELNPNADMEKIIEDADNMLYRAKNNGRNTVMPGVIKIVCDQDMLKRKETVI
ncbi:MAG: GGDEF domain-containing protein [Proteobacteria bacterium]|nr:GGDEF domain-containing protein [Pseudomonadota bacterium]MBU1386815.1 GGDEF domain-containing protein [Pseudomonadota bacterium]MBU1544759.1 GGDEF domain-containing protein [Pseudomonadota bacterium]MBU2431651.1 GGDEF domain-containing protein [Pseudomonadota bacterium]MBU2483014.1 GGDEF domain-containing protein [Pseudomonadota bacterium]